MPTNIIFGYKGIGNALARSLIHRQQSVHLVGRDATKLQQAASQLGCNYTVCDVTQEDQIEKTVTTIDKEESVSGIAYCVGSIPLKLFKQTSRNDFLDAYKLNVLGAADAIKYALPGLTKNKGSVLLFSTVAVSQGFPLHSVIASAKAAVEGLTRSLASELSPNVRVNCIAPSLTQTSLAAHLTRNEATIASLAAAHPIPRLGTPEDMASLGAFLMSNEASWITGQVIAVDGGRSTLRPKN